MVARVTLAEVDTVRMRLDALVDYFKESVVPAQREQPGYRGCYVLATPEGKALVLTLWEDAAAAAASLTGGHYERQVEKFVTVYRAQPGREAYDVVVVDAPVPATG
jgi:heme-degrading monooxygenase HmoA